jgi:diacylglycerol kinase (ATP)
MNPAAGTGSSDSALESVKADLKERDFKYELVIVDTPDEAYQAASKIQPGQFDAIAVYGGDGTVIAVFKAIYKQPLPVLILPGGSANVLAKALSLPSSVGACLDILSDDLYVLRHFGVAMANDKPLMLDLQFGFWAETILSTNQKVKQVIGQLAYAASAIKLYSKASQYSYKLRLDGQNIYVDGYGCIIANEGYHNVLGLPLFLHSHTRGLLQVAVIKDVTPRALWRWLVLRQVGRDDQSVIQTWRVKAVTVDDAPGNMLYDDDQVQAEFPLSIEPSPYSVTAIGAATTAKSLFGHMLQRFGLTQYRVYDHLRRRLTGAPSLKSSQIAPNLYLGGQYRPWAIPVLKSWGVTGVVNMRMLRRPSTSPGLEVLNLPTRDHHAPSIESLRQGVEFIDRHLAAGGGVYMHCRLGEGRGPTMAAAYLISKGMRPQDAVAHIARFRRMVRPNASQLRQLARFQQELMSKHPEGEPV